MICAANWLFHDGYEECFFWAVVGIATAYKVLPEAQIGATFGKSVMGLRVVTKDENYSPIGIYQANQRFLLAWPFYGVLFVLGASAVMEGNILLYYLESSWMLFAHLFLLFISLLSSASYLIDPNQQAWHDHIANTICIKENTL